MYTVKEQDWKLFRKKLPLWQESYMDKLNQEYIRLLSGEGLASDKFWELEKRIKEDMLNSTTNTYILKRGIMQTSAYENRRVFSL